jgi:cytochrome P450
MDHRRCVGDQFATLEAAVGLAMVLKEFSPQLDCTADEIGMVTGATIHTDKGLPMRMVPR